VQTLFHAIAITLGIIVSTASVRRALLFELIGHGTQGR
jgi:hypothetical protein